MGRTTKFSEDLLLEAVIRYSDICKSKIKATELADWARNNIKGLEEVKDYNFTRLLKNPKTGKMEKRLCTQRIEELNEIRNIQQRESSNILLSSIDINRFFELNEHAQREAIIQMREILSEYRSTNKYLKRKSDMINVMFKEHFDRLEEINKLVKKVRAKQTNLDKKVTKFIKIYEEERFREKLEEIGIVDGDFDLIKYNESLKLDINEMLDIDKIIRKYQQVMDEGDIDYLEVKEEKSHTPQSYIDILTDF